MIFLILFSLIISLSPIYGTECEKLELVKERLEFFPANLKEMTKEKSKIIKHCIEEINGFILAQKSGPPQCKNKKQTYRLLADELYIQLDQCRKIFNSMYRIYLRIMTIFKAKDLGDKETICLSRNKGIKGNVDLLDTQLGKWGLCNANRYNTFRANLNQKKIEWNACVTKS